MIRWAVLTRLLSATLMKLTRSKREKESNVRVERRLVGKGKGLNSRRKGQEGMAKSEYS